MHERVPCTWVGIALRELHCSTAIGASEPANHLALGLFDSHFTVEEIGSENLNISDLGLPQGSLFKALGSPTVALAPQQIRE